MWKSDYQYKDYSLSFDCKDGENKTKIKSVKDVVSKKTNKNMIELHLVVDNSNGVEFIDRIVEGEYFDINMSKFFDAYSIPVGNFNYNSWIGKTATGVFEHREESYMDNYGIERTTNKVVLTRYLKPTIPNYKDQLAQAQQQHFTQNQKQEINNVFDQSIF